MVLRRRQFHHAVTAFSTAIFACAAQAAPVDPALFDALAQPTGEAWMEAETRILTAWEDTGSDALNMLAARGEAALDNGDPQAAIGHLTALLDHAPDHAMGFYLRGTAFYLAGDFGPAAGDLARALALEPRHYLALTQLGVMLSEMDRPDSAAEALSASLAINPHQQDAQDMLAGLDGASRGTDI